MGREGGKKGAGEFKYQVYRRVIVREWRKTE